MLFARALATRGDLLGCARQLHEVPVWSTQRAEASLREGQSYLKLDRARDAEAAWLTALTNDVAHRIAPDLFYDIAQELLKLYAVEDRWDDAYPVIWMAYDHASPSEHEILLAMRLRPELERVSPNESREALRRYVAAAADDWEAIRALARAERALGNTDEAKRLFQMCLTGNPEDVRAWHNQLDLVLDQGDQAGFLTLLAKAPRSAEDEPETWMLRGVARERAGDLPTAAAYFRKSIGLNPFVPRYHYRLATVEQRLGLHAQAARHRERSKQMNEARAQLPSAYADFFAAREHLDGAAEMATACKHLASICATLGWFRAAQGWSCLVDTP
jgi:tetratricopeptide (TPR) repeat protein